MNQTTLQNTLAPLLAAALIGVSAQLSFPLPGTDIPQTAQTIAVLLCGSLLGPWRGSLAVVLYLIAGLVGLPVYSDGASGWATLSGGSAGYFFGFVVAATLSGVLRRVGGRDRLWLMSLHMVAAHIVILAMGCLWLARNLGIGEAIAVGVTPFIYGGIVKSVMVALIVLSVSAVRRRVGGRVGSLLGTLTS